jgi:aminocarboxymuconate-semialdehyde decarboxylase
MAKQPNEPAARGAEGAPEVASEVIDVHAHVVLEETLGAAGDAGPVLEDGEAPRFRAGDHVLEGVRYRGSPFMDVELRLQRMDAAGIDRQVLSPNPLTFFHHLEASTAVAFARRHNDALAALVATQDRLDGFAQLPLQAPDAAAEELRRAVDELGLRGAYVGTRTTRELDDPAFDALWSAAVELDVPVMLHPAPDAVDAPTRDPRLGRWDLELLIGFAYDETLAVATLVYGGVLRRFPELDVCISHGGGAAPYLYGRLAAAARQRPWAPEWLREPDAFEEQLRRLWFDCHVHDPRALDLLASTVGTDRLVFGTNFAGWDQGASGTVAAVAGTVHANTARLLARGR